MTSSPTYATPRFVRGAAAVVMVLAAAVLTGILTPFGMVLLPHAIRSMANSSGPWALIALASIYFSGMRGWRAALLGAASFVAMDLSFFVVFDSLGLYYPHTYLAFWVLVGVVIGPLVGLCASWLRSSESLPRAAGAASAPAVLVGEGVFMLVRIPGESTIYAVASIVVGIALMGALAHVLLRGGRYVAISIALAAGGATAFFVIYGLIPLLLNKVVP